MVVIVKLLSKFGNDKLVVVLGLSEPGPLFIQLGFSVDDRVLERSRWGGRTVRWLRWSRRQRDCCFKELIGIPSI